MQTLDCASQPFSCLDQAMPVNTKKVLYCLNQSVSNGTAGESKPPQPRFQGLFPGLSREKALGTKLKPTDNHVSNLSRSIYTIGDI